MTDKKKRAGVAGGEKRRAVTGRGKFEDPLTIASQSRDDFFWGRFLTKTRDGSIGKRLRAIEG